MAKFSWQGEGKDVSVTYDTEDGSMLMVVAGVAVVIDRMQARALRLALVDMPLERDQPRKFCPACGGVWPHPR